MAGGSEFQVSSVMGSSSKGSLLGDVSFVGDSFSDISEFDKQSLEAQDFRPLRKPSGMAPTTTIETVTIVRPLKVIAFICGAIVVLLMVLALASTDWLLSNGWRQGLFEHCVEDGAPEPLPFGINQKKGCYRARNEPYIMASAGLCIVALLLDVFGTFLTGMGLWTKDPIKKYKYYRLALYVMVAALLSVLIALVVYPVCFTGELDKGNRNLWEFGWAYGVGWGAAIFLFGSIVLLICDKESEEIYFKERTITHESGDPSNSKT
ncbi:unnamed protein product [Darwinula stevensoni]|uniref:Transmembrane protein 47 n=1 Tax=Darwinula stevensoni TaxID=69355 RepID=A0A7R8XJZ8_9CRUS|nr:unnamed protein product [Darwinula stevensoni]CAG0895827.1 unnamed protein product [Darwinula stevensoni]